MEVGIRTPGSERLRSTDVRRVPAADVADAGATPAPAPTREPVGDDALGTVLARAVAARSSDPRTPPDTSVLQRAYHLYDATAGKWVQLKDVGDELDALDEEVASNGPLRMDIGAKWKSQSRFALWTALMRMMEETDRATVKGYVLEAIGFNAPTKDWTFVNRENAVRAVLAESLRSEAEGKETALAKQVLGSSKTAKAIKRDVRSYGQKTLALIKQLSISHPTVINDTFAAKTQRYGYYYNPYTLWGKYTVGPRKALEAATATADCDVVKAIAAITDICSAFYKVDEAFISVTPDKQKAHSPSGTETIEDIRDDNSGTMLETSKSMMYARSHGMLVDVGPSYTTGRLLTLGVKAGASDREQVAVALALFAFWNVHYWRAASGIHHFHFVMDMLQNFVPGKYRYTGYPADISEIYDYENAIVGDVKEQDVLI
jgi:hypothetical protein